MTPAAHTYDDVYISAESYVLFLNLYEYKGNNCDRGIAFDNDDNPEHPNALGNTNNNNYNEDDKDCRRNCEPYQNVGF